VYVWKWNKEKKKKRKRNKAKLAFESVVILDEERSNERE
jgi:hypothetical protein